MATENKAIPEIHQMLFNIPDGLNMVQIGMGGTGCLLGSSILKTMGAMDERVRARLFYTAVDFDKFEPKNLGRQLCIPQDMDKNKAQVIVQRYSSVYNIPETNASYVDKKIESPEDVVKLLHPGYTNFIIEAVDKNTPRKHIHDAIKQFVDSHRYANVYLISCGNGEWNGQVGFGAFVKDRGNIIVSTPKRSIFDEPYIFSVPSPYVVCPELLDLEEDAKEEAMSCAERALINAQSMVANNTSACIGLNYVNAAIAQFNNQVVDKPNIPITNAMVRFNAQKNAFTASEMTSEYLSKELI